MSKELHDSWEITERHLKAARNLLPEIAGGDSLEALTMFEEFSEHNELGLAMEELLYIAQNNECSEEFWKELALAAQDMGLGADRDQWLVQLTDRG